jgi:hypothetical protein
LYSPIERTMLTHNRSDGGKRFVVRAGEKLTASLELESTIRATELPDECGAREITVDGLSPCW